jgi:hypothetical protein
MAGPMSLPHRGSVPWDHAESIGGGADGRRHGRHSTRSAMARRLFSALSLRGTSVLLPRVPSPP